MRLKPHLQKSVNYFSAHMKDAADKLNCGNVGKKRSEGFNGISERCIPHDILAFQYYRLGKKGSPFKVVLVWI